MPPKSKVYRLPKPILAYLDETLAANGGQKYAALEAELERRGYKVGKSNLQRYYANDLEPRLKALNMATKMAEAVAAAAGDGATMLKGTVCLLQEKIFRVLTECEQDGKELDSDNLSKLTRAVSDLSRASLQVEKFVAEARNKVLTEAATLAAASVKKAGLTDAAANEIRKKILGIGA